MEHNLVLCQQNVHGVFVLKHLTISINQCLWRWRGVERAVASAATSINVAGHLEELQAAIDDCRALSPPARRIPDQQNSVVAFALQQPDHKAIAPIPHSYNPTWPTTRPPLSWTSQYYSTTTCRPAWIPTATNTLHSGTGYSKLGFAGNDSPSFVFPTAIATKGPAAGAGGSGSGRPAVANKPTFLTGGAGGHLSGKRGTEDLDFFIGDEALAAASGPGRIHSWGHT